MDSNIKITVFHTGEVCVSPHLPYGGEKCGALKAAGIGVKKEERLWIPVSAYLVEHPKGKILVDTGWGRSLSPNGEYDEKAQIKSLGSKLLYRTNQGRLPLGEAINEQLLSRGIHPEDLDYVVLSHLDCDHAHGLEGVRGAKKVLVSNDEFQFANKRTPMNMIRYQKKWWKDVNLTTFNWNDEEGPFAKAYDLFGDGSFKCINIPGHCDGQCAIKIRNKDNKFVLLFADGGYSNKSYEELILPGICEDKQQCLASLKWIKEQSHSPDCIESLANHDPNIKPHEIIL